MTENNPDPGVGQHPADAPLEGADPGEDRQVVPGLDTDSMDTRDDPAPGDTSDPGGPPTQLAADKD